MDATSRSRSTTSRSLVCPARDPVQALLSVNGRPSGRYRCDALVIATPIGSTAYSYAAGGPLVSPMLDAMIISPVAPISGISRPAVASAAERIGLALMESSGQPALQVDGTIASTRRGPARRFSGGSPQTPGGAS